jgi:hypothetical protein
VDKSLKLLEKQESETIKSNVTIVILEKSLNFQNDNLIKDKIDRFDMVENNVQCLENRISIKTFKSPQCYFEAATNTD